MSTFHVQRLLRGCAVFLEGDDNSVEVTCQNGRIHVNILVLAALCPTWMREALRGGPFPLRLVLPSVDVEDIRIFMARLHDPQIGEKSIEALKKAMTNLSHLFDLHDLLDTEEDIEEVNDDFTDTDMDILRDNFSDQDGRLVCVVCYKIFQKSSYESFRSHLLSHPPHLRPQISDLKLECSKCLYVCRTSAQLNAHAKVHSERRFSCDSCSREFQSQKLLANHLKSGTCRLSSRQCQYCQKIFSDCTRLKHHLKTVHTGQKPWTCHICQKSFGELRTLKEHRLIHQTRRSQTCPQCNKAFVQKNHLLYHLASKHGIGDSLHRCNRCSKSFAFAFQLKKHRCGT